MANADPIRKALSIAISVGLATTATAALAKNPPKPPAGQGTAELQRALDQMGGTDADVQSLQAPSGDGDQGDENASPRAKERVCSKEPAGDRSAICGEDVTPD